MKKIMIISIVCLGIIMTSCLSSNVLTGTYQESFTSKTNKSYDEVWNDVIDFFALSGIPINTFEKASGLIVAHTVKVSVTEEINGVPVDKNAYIVIPDISSMYKAEATATFNIRVRDNGDYVQIYVNLHDINAYYIEPLYGYKYPIIGKSTGAFEQKLIDMLKWNYIILSQHKNRIIFYSWNLINILKCQTRLEFDTFCVNMNFYWCNH